MNVRIVLTESLDEPPTVAARFDVRSLRVLDALAAPSELRGKWRATGAHHHVLLQAFFL